MIKAISIAVSISIVSVFVYTMHQHVINIPSYDDYAATLIFIKNHYYLNSDLAGKIRALFLPHGEHYILMSRLSAVLEYTFLGSIDFSALVWYQNIYLVGVFALILGIMHRQNLSMFPLLIPVTLFLFSLSFWQVTLYYWGGVQYYAVFFFAILSLYLLNKAGEDSWLTFFGAVVCGALAIFSFGNGILILPLGGFLLAVQNKRKQLWIWSGFSLFCLVLFLSGHHSSFGSKPPFNIFWMGKLLFTYLGSFLYVSPEGDNWRYTNIILCMTVGSGVMYLWLRLLFKGYAFRNPFLYCLLSLPILTGILISLARFDAKAAGGIAPRYQFFSACIPVFLLLIYYQHIEKSKKPLILPIITLTLVVWGLSFWNNWREIEHNNSELVQTFRQWQRDTSIPLVYYNPDPAYSEALSWALTSGVYTFPSSRVGVEEGRKLAKAGQN